MFVPQSMRSAPVLRAPAATCKWTDVHWRHSRARSSHRTAPRCSAAAPPAANGRGSATASDAAGLSRRAAGTAVLSAAGAAVLLGLEAVAGFSRAAARVSIAQTLKGAEGERDIQVTASGIRVAAVSAGRGEPLAAGQTILLDLVASLEDGTVIFDTSAEGAAPIAVQLGTTNKVVTEGLSQVLETMREGDARLAVVPPSLAYGAQGVQFRSGARVPPNALVYYEVTVLRCQSFELGLACCVDSAFPCVGPKPAPEAATPPG